jgi:hypothetical protein
LTSDSTMAATMTRARMLRAARKWFLPKRSVHSHSIVKQ